MDTPDPYELISAGSRVQVELAPEVRARFTVEFLRRNLATIWCRLGPEREPPHIEAGSRVMTMEVGDAAGMLKVPVMPSAVAAAEGPDGTVLTVAFKVLSGTLWIQRRKYFRLRNPPIGITLRSARPDGDGPVDLPARAVNLGGGGLAVTVPAGELQAGADVEVLLNLARTAPLSARGVVLRVEPAPNAESLLSIQFTDIRESHRDRLVSLIFREQTRRRASE